MRPFHHDTPIESIDLISAESDGILNSGGRRGQRREGLGQARQCTVSNPELSYREGTQLTIGTTQHLGSRPILAQIPPNVLQLLGAEGAIFSCR